MDEDTAPEQPLSNFVGSLGDRVPPSSSPPGKYLHLDGSSFPANMSPIYNWTLMLTAFGIMLIGPLLIMQSYKPG